MSDVPITDQDFLNDSTLIDQEATSILEKHTLASGPNALANFTDEELDEEADAWAEIGRAFATSYMGDWRYSIYHGWAEWNGRHWVMHSVRDANQTILDSAVQSILGIIKACKPGDEGEKMAKAWRSSGHVMNSFLAGCRNERRGRIPEPDYIRFFPANNGVVDMETGDLLPHAPEYGFRAVANGNYMDTPDHPPLGSFITALNDRLRPALSEEERDTFFSWCGLVATGKVQSYNGAICMLVGPPGSGKGGILKLLRHGLGKLYFTGKSDMFSSNRPAGHHNDLAILLLAQPMIVGLDERGTGSTRLQIDILNSFTGDTEQGPFTRKGDPTPISGTPRFAVIHAAVQAPKLPTDTGLERRICAIATHKELEEQDREPELPEYLADALVTMMCIRARRWNEAPPQGVKGTKEAQAQVYADMEPEMIALKERLEEEPDYWNGQNLSALLADLKVEFPKMTSQWLRGKVTKKLGWRIGPNQGKGDMRGSPLIAP